jgi:hypothetical protein
MTYNISLNLVKSTRPGVDFTSILCAAFMGIDPKSANKYSQAISLFVLLEFACVKTAHKHVDEIDPMSLR